ncbi:MAG: hypothetical protein OQK82_07350 [Candidatus Pacearchaeota archaeon]|nr:hypothetical protein [Candidatus Pacearchaeota archaeon]
MQTKQTLSSEFVDLSEHFARLCRFLYRDATVIEKSAIELAEPYKTEEFWGVVAEPLRIGGSIKNIEVIPEIIEPGGSAMCGQAWDYESALCDITSLYTFALTRFMWSWVAFENLANRCCSNCQGRGVTGKAIEYMKNGNAINLIGLASCQGLAIDLVEKQIIECANRAAKRTDSERFLYIHLCREARNELFHAHHKIIEPFYDEEDNLKLNNDSRVVLLEAMTRLTLLSIQSILGIYFRKSTVLTGWLMESRGIPTSIELSRVIEVLHLDNQSCVYQSQLEYNDA